VALAAGGEIAPLPIAWEQRTYFSC
jgi:hypothetical protein